MNYETVRFETKGAVAVVTLNRPEKKNALTEQMHRELIRICDRVDRSDELKVLVLTGGSDVFCTGADLADVSKTEDGLPTGPNAIERLNDMTKPTIAAISGWCIAGGIELALSCDFRVAAETARIGDRHIRIGFIGGAGSPTRLVRVLGMSKAMELILTGDTIDGNEAFRIGLVSKVVPVEKLMSGAMELAEKIAAYSSLALVLSKKAVKAAAVSPEHQSLHTTQLLLLELLSSAEYKERIAAFLKKRG
ncbi:MAG: enoyl-CoA hydratase/isomerase family protein [Desulfobacteraceae bacterium]|nr:MAG: enoyl-CoA hydratase/isomerase family protein [Desulfobacteraceae bacterium]